VYPARPDGVGENRCPDFDSLSAQWWISVKSCLAAIKKKLWRDMIHLKGNPDEAIKSR